jgi:hypothetical protein
LGAAADHSIGIAFITSDSSTAAAGSAASAAAAADVTAAAADDPYVLAAAAGLQVYWLEELEARAAAAEAVLAAGQQLQPHHMAVVPDASRPFTLTMTSGRDGVAYVVAHYEPNALQHSSSKLAALLCEVRPLRSECVFINWLQVLWIEFIC